MEEWRKTRSIAKLQWSKLSGVQSDSIATSQDQLSADAAATSHRDVAVHRLVDHRNLHIAHGMNRSVIRSCEAMWQVSPRQGNCHSCSIVASIE